MSNSGFDFKLVNRSLLSCNNPKSESKVEQLTQAMDYLKEGNLSKKVNFGLNADEKMKKQLSSLACRILCNETKLNLSQNNLVFAQFPFRYNCHFLMRGKAHLKKHSSN